MPKWVLPEILVEPGHGIARMGTDVFEHRAAFRQGSFYWGTKPLSCIKVDSTAEA